MYLLNRPFNNVTELIVLIFTVDAKSDPINNVLIKYTFLLMEPKRRNKLTQFELISVT